MMQKTSASPRMWNMLVETAWSRGSRRPLDGTSIAIAFSVSLLFMVVGGCAR